MKNKSIKSMLFGIVVILAGIYCHIEPGIAQHFYGGEYLIVVLGIIISILGGIFLED